MIEFDLVVIGAGAAGLAAARTAVRARARVALVSDGPPGGDCTFTGCVPSKTLIEAAAHGAGFTEAMAAVRATVAGSRPPRNRPYSTARTSRSCLDAQRSPVQRRSPSRTGGCARPAS